MIASIYYLALNCLFSLLFVCEHKVEHPALTGRTGDDIVWTADYKLNWSNFNGRPSNGHHADALTSGSIFFSYTDNRDGIYEISIIASFHPSESWVRHKKGSDYLLAHEQLHFDLTELYARKLREKVLSYHHTKKDFKKHYDKMFNEIYRELQHMQDLYDRETSHSLNKSAQKKWHQEIDAMLAQSSSYTDTEFKIKILK